MTETQRCKICLLGDGGVGKSCLSIYFSSHIFINEPDPTIEDCHTVRKEIEGQAVLLEVLDTAESEYFELFRPHWVKRSQALLIVYSTTSRQSFENIPRILERTTQVKKAELKNIPFLLVGNKADLESERQVSTKEGFEISCQFQVPFFETSAKYGVNVDEVFFALVREFITKRSGEDLKEK